MARAHLAYAKYYQGQQFQVGDGSISIDFHSNDYLQFKKYDSWIPVLIIYSMLYIY